MGRKHHGLSRVPRNLVRLDHGLHLLSSNERGYRPIERCEREAPTVRLAREETMGAQQQYILEQLNDTAGKRRITARTELEFVDLCIEAVEIHE